MIRKQWSKKTLACENHAPLGRFVCALDRLFSRAQTFYPATSSSFTNDESSDFASEAPLSGSRSRFSRQVLAASSVARALSPKDGTAAFSSVDSLGWRVDAFELAASSCNGEGGTAFSPLDSSGRRGSSVEFTAAGNDEGSASSFCSSVEFTAMENKEGSAPASMDSSDRSGSSVEFSAMGNKEVHFPLPLFSLLLFRGHGVLQRRDRAFRDPLHQLHL